MKSNFLKNIKIQRSILLVFLFAGLTIVFFVKLISSNMTDTHRTDFMVNHTYEVTKGVENIETGLAETESATRAYVATGDKRWQNSVNELQQEAIRLVTEMQRLVIDTIQKKRLAELEQVIRRKINFQQAIINADADNTAATSNLQSGLVQKISYDGEDRMIALRIKTALTQFMERQDLLLQQRLSASKQAKNKALVTAIGGSAMIFIFITGTLLRLNRDMSRRKEAEKEIRESESKYRQLIEEAGVTMFTADLNGMFTYVSSRCHSLTGFTVAELTGQNFSMLVLPDSINTVIDTYVQQLSTLQKESTIEFPIITKEGHLKWVEQHAVLLYNEHRQPAGYQCVVKDITERKEAEQRIKGTERMIRAQREEYQFRLQSILDNTPAIVFIKDLKGRYLIINQAFRDAYGLKNEDVIGKTDFDFDTTEEATRYKKVDEEVISTLRSVETEETFHASKGEQNLLLLKFPLFDKDNNIYGVGGIATDFTENVQFREKLITAKKKAESAEQLQEQFLANMSHEIRTPMNGITGMVNILMDTPLDEKQKEFVKIIKQSSDSLLFLINDILDLSKIKSGKLSLEKTAFDLYEVVDNTLAPFYLKSKEKNIELSLVQNGSLPRMLEGDPYRLNQILNNLLSNALKFTEQGAIRLYIRQVALDAKDVNLEFAVSDTGVGIPSDKLESIFNSFEQASTSTTRQYGGTGLGLAICKQLVELQEGNIAVTSTVGKGTTFYFTIRYTLTDNENQVNNSADKTNNHELAGKKILIAEDNEINQKVISYILGKEGIITTLANNGREAVTLMEQGNSYDLIIMDLQMPVMDGFQATNYIRKKLQSNIPIIAMTASVLRNEKKKSLELGMNEYLSKPFVPAELFAQLKRFLFAEQGTAVTHQQPVTSNQDLYDLSYLREMDDNEYLCEILQLFLETTPISLKDLSNEVLRENWEMVHKHAHKLKSSLGILKMNRMLELVSTIEQQAKKNTDTNKIERELKEAIEQFGLTRPMIEAELTSAMQSAV